MSETEIVTPSLQITSSADAMKNFAKLTEELNAGTSTIETTEVPTTETTTPKAEESTETTTETTETTTPTAEAPKSLEDLIAEDLELKATEQKKKDFESLYEDELAKTILEAKKQGKDLRQVLKALSETDPNDFTEIDLFTLSLKGETNDDGTPLTKEDIELKYEQFKEMPKSIQKQVLDGQKAELENKFKETTKVLSVKTENPYIESAKKANEDLLVALKEMVGTNYHGLEITTKIAKELFDEASLLLPSTLDKNSFNVSLALDKAKAIKFMPYLINDAKNKGKTEGKTEVFDKVHSPSASGKPISTKPQSEKTPEERAKEELESFTNFRKNPFGVKTN